MIKNKETIFSKDLANKKLNVVREFDAPLEQVWKAWTESELLDRWWAPKPWQAITMSMDFREGGIWLYYMQGPDGTKSYCRANFISIDPKKSFISEDLFCDENGNLNSEFPVMRWKSEFSKIESGTRVSVEITYSSVADMEKIIEMGFKEGFSAAHENLDELLASL